MKNRIKAFRKKIPVYRDQPALFCQEILKFEPDKWQTEVLNDIASHRLVSVRSGQGVGKTGLEASVTLWFLSCFPFPKVVCTAPTRQQLHDVLWAEINKWQSKSPILKKILKWTKTKIYMRKYEERWFATARTATKPENMQGFHEDNMLFIVDEASGVADDIMEAILGTLSGDNNKMLMCGNPTRTSGVFYDSHNRDRQDYRTHKVSSLDSKRTSKENIKMLLRKYGKDSDVARVRIYGEFPKAEADAFIALELVEFATGVKLEPNGEVLHLGVDVARFGDDETIIAPRIGNKVFDLNSYNKQDTMVTSGWVLNIAKSMMKQHIQIKQVEIKVDDSGVGGGVTDRLKEVIFEEGLPYRVIPVNNGSSPSEDEKEHYDNKGTESWAVLREILQDSFSKHMQGEEPSLEFPEDERLITQLSSRKFRMTSRGKVALERKEDMKKRGLDSPDRADAVVLSFVTEEALQWSDQRPSGW
jgi:phage terminase large subunit